MLGSSGRRGLGLVLAVCVAGCAAQTTAPVELSRIYARESARAAELLPSTLLVPGLLGTQILDGSSGRIYWGAVGGESPNVSKDPVALKALALAPDLQTPFVEMTDELQPGDVLRVVQADTPFGALRLRGYPGVLEGVASWLVEGDASRRVGRLDMDAKGDDATGIGSAPFDWRMDVVASARRLDKVVRAASARHEARTGDAHVDLIGHSLGSLVVRWYLMYGTADLRPDGSPPPLTWAGARLIRTAILVAPPSAGSPMVLESLLSGERVSSFLPRYPAALVGTFPSAYEMLPRTVFGSVVYTDDETPVDVLDPDVWIRYGWGILAPDEDEHLAAILPDARTREARVAAASAWVRRCLERARGVQAALDVHAELPEGLHLHLFAGDSRATPSRLGIDRRNGDLHWLGSEPGDGRVTRRSAVFDARTDTSPLDSPIPWSTVTWSGGEHFGIVRDPVFLDGALWLLLQDEHTFEVR